MLMICSTRFHTACASRATPDAAKPADGQAPVQAASDRKSGVRLKKERRESPPPRNRQRPHRR